MKRLFRSFRRRFSSPQVVAKGNFEENLAAHPNVDIAPIGRAAGLHVPVWVDVAPDVPSRHTFETLLWEVEPYGEYLYHLAGDFPQNEKGLLRYASATLSAAVHVCFETDVIAIAEHDQALYAAQAQAAVFDDADLGDLTVPEAQSLIAQGSGFACLRDAAGHSHIEGRAFVTPLDRASRRSVVITTCLIDRTGPRDRVTMISTACSRADMFVAPMVSYHRKLVEKYADIAQLNLSGAIRM